MADEQKDKKVCECGDSCECVDGKCMCDGKECSCEGCEGKEGCACGGDCGC